MFKALAVCPYPEPDWSTLWFPHIFWEQNLTCSFCLWLGLLSGLFPSGFPTKSPVHLSSRSKCHIPQPSNLSKLATRIVFGLWYQLGISILRFAPVPYFFIPYELRSLWFFFYSCSDLLLLWSETFYTTWRLRGTVIFLLCVIRIFTTEIEKFQLRGNNSVCAEAVSYFAAAYPRS
jgi:hypothetical protein